MSPTTLLRLLAINDERAPALITNLVEIVPVATGEGGEPTDRMSHWLQHVHLLGTEQVPTFDLLFIDIRFHEDRFAPKYGDGKVNPLGLLHALTFAARQDPSQAPFVWGYHSGEPETVKDDPIAIIVFSLLSALEQRGETAEVKVGGKPWKWNDVGIHNLDVWYDPNNTSTPHAAIRHFSKAIANLPKGGSEVIWQKMIVRYRQKFLDYVDNERIFIDQDQVGLLLRMAQKGSQEDRSKLATASLDLSGPPGRPWTRKILLQSLFADELIRLKDIWPEGDALTELVKFLTTFKKMGMSGGTNAWFQRVRNLMKLVKLNETPPDNDDDDQESKVRRTRVLQDITPMRDRRCLGALGVICWWLERKAEETPCITEDLLISFGYKGNDRDVVQGCLASLSHTKLKEFFDYLEKTNDRLPPLYAAVGRKWWIEVCKKDGAKAPKCVR